MPAEDQIAGRKVLTGLFGVRAVRIFWVFKWLAAFIGLLLAVGVIAGLTGSK
jgi:hypothetical protein